MNKIAINCIGYNIAADWYEGTSDEMLLVLVGFTSNKSKYQDFVQTLVSDAGMSALVVDYSGHGESPFELDELTPAQHFLEVITAFDWLKNLYPNKKINVMGTSYGGFLATQLTKYRSFNKLVLRVPALYPPEDFYTKWGDNSDVHRKEYRERYSDDIGHPLLRRVSKFGGKTFVVIHEKDELCPENTTTAFAEAFSADVWRVPGFAHGIGNKTQDELRTYYNKIADWLKND